MSLFAEYRPGKAQEPLSDLLLRPAELGDAAELAQLVLERDGGELATHMKGFEREAAGVYPRTEHRLFVAEHAGRAVGFGRTKFYRHEADVAEDIAPEGWYLGGVIVQPELRRRGIARSLTARRIEDLRGDARELYYIVKAANRASIDLHEGFGFVELTREFSYPRVQFEGEVGILFRLGLDVS